MRLLITIFAIILACANAAGQGKVTFGNDSAHLFNGYDGPLTGSPLSDGKTLMAVLYAGTNSSSLILQTTVILDSSGIFSPGRMVNKNVVLTGVPGGAAAYFKIFIVDTGAVLPSPINGADVTAGPSGYTHFGTSGLFTATPGSGLSFPSLVSGGTSASTWTGPIGLCLGCVSPNFTLNPSNTVVRLGDNVTLTASASSYPLFSIAYQWRKQFAPIVSATNSHLTLTNVTLADSGNYDVVASNFYDTPPLHYGSAASAVASVTVVVPAQLGSLSYTTNNQFQFTVTGSARSNYVVQVATNLAIPTTWVPLLTNASPFTFVDSNAQNFPQRFYRANAL